MSRLPLISAKEMIGILMKIGFEMKRQKGSHKFFKHPDCRTTVIPDHGSEMIDRGLLNKIIKQDIMISIDDFLNLK